MSNEKNASIELRQKMENLGALIRLGFIPKDDKYWNRRWAEWDSSRKATREFNLRQLRRAR